MGATQKEPPSLAGDPADRWSERFDFSAPLGLWKSGLLVFASGVERLELRAHPKPELYQARFLRCKPGVWVQENRVTIDYRHTSHPDRLADLDSPLAEISLNSSIPWEVELRNGASRLTADLSGLRLRSIDILNGASQIQVKLPQTSGISYIYISGGISQGTILAPENSGVRVRVSGGAVDLSFDGQRFEAIDGEICLSSPGFSLAKDGYDIRLAGGASLLTIGRRL